SLALLGVTHSPRDRTVVSLLTTAGREYATSDESQPSPYSVLRRDMPHEPRLVHRFPRIMPGRYRIRVETEDDFPDRGMVVDFADVESEEENRRPIMVREDDAFIEIGA